MNKLSYFTFIFVFGFFINLSLQNDSEAYVCATNADGDIILSDAGVAGTAFKDEVAFGTTNQPAPFNYTTGVVDDDGFNSNLSDQCSAEPLFYKMKVYTIAMCTSDPYGGDRGGTSTSINPNFEDCINILNAPDGKIVEIEKGVDGNDLLDGSELIIPTGEYPYLAIVLSNHLHVKHVQGYVNDEDGAVNMYGTGSLDGSGNIVTAKVGKYCYSTAIVSSYSGLWAGDSTYQNAHLDLEGNAVTIVDTSSGTSGSRMICVSDKATALAAAAYATEIIDHFGDLETDDHTAIPDNFIPYADVSEYYKGAGVTDVSLAGTSMAANMLNADGITTAQSFVNAQRIGMYLKFTQNIPKITEDTVGLKLNIGTTMGISIDSGQDINDGTAVVQSWMVKVGVDPFTAVIQVQDRDPRGVRGAFR